MKTSKPTTVLIFLATCLAFAEALAGIAGSLNPQASPIWILLFGTINLILVLTSLLYMFWKKPEFLVAERQDLVPLAAIQAILQQNDPKLMRELLKSLNLGSLKHPNELPPVDRSEAESGTQERREISEEQAKIKKKLSLGD